MSKIVLDRTGNLLREVFYRFAVPFDDGTDRLPRTQDWIVAPRTPTGEQLADKGASAWMWMSGLGDDLDRVSTRDCPADSRHVTRWHFRSFQSEAFGGKRVSPIIATSIGEAVAISSELHRQLDMLKVRGALLIPIDVKVHTTGKKADGFWALQFIGIASIRIPSVVGAPNTCPFCNKGVVLCEKCGHYDGACRFCKKAMIIVQDSHNGRDDKRLPFEPNLWNILEGNTWDGSDLIQAHGENFASKRFIDWLLRIHAAPFYAEPVYFCVDGMNDQQKKWFNDLQKPLEA